MPSKSEMKRVPDNKKVAEEVFCDDILSEKLISGGSLEKELTDSDVIFSKELLRAINSDKGRIDSEDKFFLAGRITESIEKSKKRKLYSRMGYAASLLIIAGLSVYFASNNRSDIAGYGASISAGETSNLTQLMLPQGKIIQIETPESKIAYSKNGNTVVINAGDEINQSVENNAVAYNTVLVPYGKRSQVTLADNSTIWLNSGSKLVYPVRFADNKREVYLEGEALFEVTHRENQPFHVLTKGIEVRVLGTVFDLSAYDEDSTINTVLERGMVELVYNKSMFGSSRTKLIPGKLASYRIADQSVVLEQVNTKDFTSWKDGYMALEKKSLESIVRRLSRYYNVTIEFENPELAKETFSGYLDLRNSAMQVLGMISEMMDIEIAQTENVIRIKRKGSSV